MLFLLTLWPSKLIESQNFHEKPTTPTPSFADEETEAQNSASHTPKTHPREAQEHTTQARGPKCPHYLADLSHHARLLSLTWTPSRFLP